MRLNNELRNFILNEINGKTFFRTKTLSKLYIDKILGVKNTDIRFQSLLNSTSIKIGYLTKELEKLGLIIDYSKSSRNVWKNLYKGSILEEIKKKNNTIK